MLFNLAKGFDKNNAEKWSLRKTPYGGEEGSGGALTPFLAPCSAQEIRREKMSPAEPQRHKAWHGLSPNIERVM